MAATVPFKGDEVYVPHPADLDHLRGDAESLMALLASPTMGDPQRGALRESLEFNRVAQVRLQRSPNLG